MKLKIVLIGLSWPFSTKVLDSLCREHEVVMVFESFATEHEARRALTPRRKLGDFVKHVIKKCLSSTYHSLYRGARKHGLNYAPLTRKRQKELARVLQETSADVLCVTGLSFLLKKPILEIPKIGALNLHPSLLPKYRGPSPLFWQLHEMEQEGGVTVHEIDEEIDHGDIISQKKFPIPQGMTIEEMEEKCGDIGGRLILDAVRELEKGTTGTPQRDVERYMYARHVVPSECLVDWSWPIERVWHFIHGSYPRFRGCIPPPPGWRAALLWKIGGYSKEAISVRPATLSRDSRGYFLAHRDGKIRLSVDLTPFGLVRAWRHRYEVDSLVGVSLLHELELCELVPLVLQ